MNRPPAVLCGCLMVALCAVPAAGDKIADIEKELTAANRKLNSVSAKMKTVQKLDLGGGNSMNADLIGTFEWLRQADTVMHRIEMSGTTVQKIGGQETKTETPTLMMSDGKFSHSLTEYTGQKIATKTKAGPAESGNIKYIFEVMRSESTLKVLPDEKAAGYDCYVIESAAKGPEAATIVRQVHYFAKDLGLDIKTVGYDPAGKAIFTTEMFDIKKNAKIDPDRFVFKAPPGVQVIDRSGQ
ncbi:MAG: outer membrane lipoprotein carrier protein LolA [bacterium]|nr:outer membrane lipoprotein carrier protein LolA [bacterium]